MTAPPPDIHREVFGPSPSRALGSLCRPSALRPLSRLLVIAGWTLGCLLVFLPGMGLLRPWPDRRLTWRRRMVRRWARGLTRVVGMRVTVSGPRPVNPFFLVANHLSYVDIVLLFAELQTVFVAKRELVHWPVIGYLTRLGGTIFVDRGSPRNALQVLESIAAGIARGEGIVVFPEGTSSSGDDVSPLRPALFEWAARSGFPVHVATIGYRTPPGSRSAREAVCWWGSMTFVPHVIDLCRLPRFDAQLTFGDQPLVGTDRADLAARARQAIAAQLTPHADSQ